ncbi:hypothetical protein EJF36_07340 [Bacillus sp. HMF5848]|uniref:PH domain-containing protein n=1 Tax=Bacillus sp. HMF5848 TaxID=2495421 RepID=UPI000F774901|nr:PH domain-containing protein [Bacillus sp. HMF5848]RSK26686.1 hypothetical protein EJF36_07340 [Bacillus sp. HMF5848]
MRQIPNNMIAKDALKVWRLVNLIQILFFWAIGVGYLWLTLRFSLPLWISITFFFILILTSILSVVIMPKLKWKRWRYDVFAEEIDLMYGVFIQKRTLIPMVRVQHVDTKQGPLLRKYNLATVTISTAATVHEIPALLLTEADQLRDHISQLARVSDDE